MTKINGFNGNCEGLTTKEVIVLQEQYGLNVLTSEKRSPLFQKMGVIA